MTETMNNPQQEDYHYDMQQLTNQAMENLGRNKEYRRLLDQFDTACRQRNLVAMSKYSERINELKQREVQRLVAHEDQQRMDVNRLATLLKQVSPDDYNRYQEMVSGLSLLLDMTDTIFSDINKILRRNSMGIEMNNFPELEAARKTAWQMASVEQDMMPAYKHELWSAESERIYQYLLGRCATYRRKVDRIEARMERIKDTLRPTCESVERVSDEIKEG